MNVERGIKKMVKMYLKDFQDKVDELSEKYDIARGIVYDVMVRVKNELRIKRSEDFKSDKHTFYRKTYFITNMRLMQQQSILQPSNLENISSEAYDKNRNLRKP
jgi:hypothetical protein